MAKKTIDQGELELGLRGERVAVTVIVCTRNRPRELEACLAGLAGLSSPTTEVLVVDNGSSPPVADICSRWGARYAIEPKAGLCIARNTGARLAQGEIVAYVDDDAVAEGAWLDTLLTGFEDPSVSAVTGGIRYMKALGDSREMSDSDAPEAGSLRPPGVFDRHSANWFALATLGGIGDGGNMAFRRSALLASPGFDNRLGRGRLLDGGDEHVLFMSLVALGHRIAHVPAALVRHPYPGMQVQMHARSVCDRRTSIAYLMFLWGEFPAHRADIVRHLAGAVAKRLARGAAPEVGAPRLTYVQALQAALAGALLYIEARKEWASIPAPDYRGLAVA